MKRFLRTGERRGRRRFATAATDSHAVRAERLFRRLLRLFPAEFRGDFGDDMAQTFGDQRRHTLVHGGTMGLARLWWDTVRGVATTAPREHWDLLCQDVRYA